MPAATPTSRLRSACGSTINALAFNEACGLERTGHDSDAYFELVLTRERSRNHPVHRRFRSRYPIAAS